MSDDSDVSPSRSRRKRKPLVTDGSSSDTSVGTVSRSRRRRKYQNYIRESESDSDSSIEVIHKKKRIGRVTFDSDTSTSGSDIVRRKKVVSTLETDSSDSNGFEYESEWVTDPEDNVDKTANIIKSDHQDDKGASSDSSDGQSEKCPICLLPFKSQEVGSPESCDHCFCVDCIVEWSKNVNTCPVDRQTFNLILVRKNYNGKVTKQIPIEPPQQQNEVDEIVEDPTFCEICGRCDREDRMLLCDGCDLGFHLECLEPPLTDVPAGVWYCSDCGPDPNHDDPMIDIYEVHLLLEDAETLGWPTGPRRRNSSAPRLVPRTRQSERVRARIITHRNQRRESNNVNDDTPQPQEEQNLNQPGPSMSATNNPASSTNELTRRNKKRKRRKQKRKIRITYEIDDATGERIAIKTKIRKKRRKRKNKKHRERARRAGEPKTVKKRLAVQLGMCPTRTLGQALPEVRNQNNPNTIGFQRREAGIPTLHLFGQRDELDYFSGTESEGDGDGVNVLIRRRPNLSDAAIIRRTVRRKALTGPPVTSSSIVSSSTNILDSILDSQAKFHSKNSVLTLNKDGTLQVGKKGEDNNNHNIENNRNFGNNGIERNNRDIIGDRNRVNLNNHGNSHFRQRPMYGNGSTNETAPTYRNVTEYNRRDSFENTNAVTTSSSEPTSNNRLQDEGDSDQNYSVQPVCSSFDFETDNKKDKDKDKSGADTPLTHSDSEFDIYSDIETVSTSRAEESDVKVPSPARLVMPNTPTDEDGNNSDGDLIIDTEKVENDKFDDSKEQVSSTVDSTGPITASEPCNSQAPHSTSDIQHEIVQSSGQNDNKTGGCGNNEKEDDDEDSEDGCPNFSIYSSESINLAKNTDLQLLNDNSLPGPANNFNSNIQTTDKLDDNVQSTDKLDDTVQATFESDDAVESSEKQDDYKLDDTVESSEKPQELSEIDDINLSESDRLRTGQEKLPAQKDEMRDAYRESSAKVVLKPIIISPVKRSNQHASLYSDSEDESVVKISGESFGISDIRNMTEDISEEERSYTPCLDEKAPSCKQGLEGLDTELISDEDRNDFDESHELKTVSDGDALEINAKESELDFSKPEDYEEGEIVDKLKGKVDEEPPKVIEKEKEKEKEPEKKKEEKAKENEVQTNAKDSSFKKLSKSNKERNYRDKDKDKERPTSRSKEKKDRSDKENKKGRKKEKRKEIERYNVRSMLAEKPKRITKDKFGRELRRRSDSRSSLSLTPPRQSPSAERPRSLSRNRSKKRRERSTHRSLSPSWSPERKRSRSRNKKRRSASREKTKRRSSPERPKRKPSKERHLRHKSRTPSPRRRRDWRNRRRSRGWSRSASRSCSPEQRLTPSWTPPRVMESQAVRPQNLTVILNNDLNKKKKEKRRKEKRAKELEKAKRRRRERTPPPSKEVFASGNNILVSVSFNKDSNERDVTKRKRDSIDSAAAKKARKEKEKRKVDERRKKRNKDISGIKPVAIIDLERSPFREITPSPEDVIVLTDSENGESNDMLALQTAVCDSSQQVASPERSVNGNYLTGPKTPPEPQVKFSLNAKQPQMRAINNPLHEPDDVEVEIDPQEELEQRLNDTLHKGPNTPPEPPNSPPSSPDVYDPFDPTKSRSPTPEPLPQTVQSSTSQNDNTRDESLLDSRNDDDLSGITDAKSHTPPVVADIQPADSQSNLKPITPEKSPERPISVIINQVVQSAASVFPAAATKPSAYSTTSSVITSTPIGNLAAPRINILNSTILAPSAIASSVPQRIVLPNTTKSSPVKVSPNKLPIKSTPIKPMPAKNIMKKSRKSNNRTQNGTEIIDVTLDFDSPYSPGSSDYEDLFEPPPDTGKASSKSQQKNTKSPAKVQSVFDNLFGQSPVNNSFKKKSSSKYKKNVKGTKLVGVKIDEDTLKILDELPNSAVEMQVKDKYLKKLNRQERVVEEVKLVLKPHYNKKHINKEEYKDILRRSVPKICHNKSGEINPKKIQNLIEAYVKKIRHSKKVTSSSSVNPQKV